MTAQRDRRRLTAGPIQLGCASCTDRVVLGSVGLRYDDGEYYPEFCLRCVNAALAETMTAPKPTPEPSAGAREAAQAICDCISSHTITPLQSIAEIIDRLAVTPAVVASEHRCEDGLVELLDRLATVEAERDSYRKANESAAVCAEHVGSFVGDGCLVCERDAALRTAERLRGALERIASWHTEDGHCSPEHPCVHDYACDTYHTARAALDAYAPGGEETP